MSSSSSVPTSSTGKPKTLTGRIVERGDAKSLEDLKRLNLIVKEPEIIDLLYPNLKEEILKVTNIGQGQYQRKAFVAVGDGNGLIGLGKRCAQNDQEAINGARRNAKISLFQLETAPTKTLPISVSGQFGTVHVQLDPWIIRIHAPPMVEKILKLCGFNAALHIGNCDKATGAVVEAVFNALKKLELK